MTRHTANPSLLTAAAEVAAERYGMPIIDADRSRLIAALHALINWLIDHPGIPVPGSVEVSFHPLSQGGRIDSARLVELATELGGELGSASGMQGPVQWMRAPVCATGEHGARVDYVVFAGDERANKRRFIA